MPGVFVSARWNAREVGRSHDRPAVGGDDRSGDLSRMTEHAVVSALAEWFEDYHHNGGRFSQEALAAAGEAARHSVDSGSDFAAAFEAGLGAFFGELGSCGRMAS